MMSNEEFDKRMEFFLHQQAQFDADMQEFRETQKELQRTTKATAEGLAELTSLTYEGFNQTIRRFDAVARSFKVIAENGRETDARINALVDAQIHTEELIRNIGGKLDRHLKEDHNGGQPNNP